ncbi:hypothetical protein KEJ39_04190 [Candidatus Bathyarchaeota archaeon]|nr:hypothetical protein [Candidatus Bathyarchaeota archaeon]
MVKRLCQWIMDVIERLLTETDTVPPFREKISKKTRKTQLPPPRILVYGIFTATLFFSGLLILEIVHLILLRSLEQQVLNLMGYVVTFVVGAFFGAKRS